MNDLHQIIKKIGAKLKAMRKAAGYSSYENFAFDNDLSRIQYFKMERGTNFTLSSLIKILNAHGIDFYDFIRQLDPDKHNPKH